MRPGLALSLLLTAVVAGFGAGMAVFLEWSRMASVPGAVSPALWASRAYLVYFDLSAVIAFLPCRAFCRWMCNRLHAAAPPPFVVPGPARREPEFPLQEAL